MTLLNQGSLLKNSLLRQPTPDCTLPAFSLSAIYRCVPRSCHKVIKQNLYQRKFSCIPHLSKYSCFAFSRSSSVGAVLNVVYNWRFTILSNFSINALSISGRYSSFPARWYWNNASNKSFGICTCDFLSMFLLSVTVVTIVTIFSLPTRYIKYRHNRHISSRLFSNKGQSNFSSIVSSFCFILDSILQNQSFQADI